MPTSQNLRFTATADKDAEFEHPPGAALMRSLSTKVAVAGWATDNMDNWRDCGWSLACRKASSELEVVIIWVQRGYWLLQVSPCRVPGFVGRLFGGQVSASPSDVYQLSLCVHHALSTLQCLGNPQWRWDGFPDDKNSAPDPQPPPVSP
jgi:hypothetical protein